MSITPDAYAVVKNGEAILPCATRGEACKFAAMAGGTVEPLYRAADVCKFIEAGFSEGWIDGKGRCPEVHPEHLKHDWAASDSALLAQQIAGAQ